VKSLVVSWYAAITPKDESRMVHLGHVPEPPGRVAFPQGVEGTEVGAMCQTNLDLRVHDRVALDEIELYSEILSAVAMADRPLTTDEIDMVLGIGHVAGS
jgi:hypothetical protein